MKGITKLDSCAINYRCYAQKGVHKILMTKSTSALKVQCTFQCETSSLKAETLFAGKLVGLPFWLSLLSIHHISHIMPHLSWASLSLWDAIPSRSPRPLDLVQINEMPVSGRHRLSSLM